jgi:hypothetical protein
MTSYINYEYSIDSYVCHYIIGHHFSLILNFHFFFTMIKTTFNSTISLIKEHFTP